MEPLTYLIAIMGCADSGAMCQQARVEPVRYPSAAACQAAMPSALRRNTDLSYPVISAACQADRNPRMVNSNAKKPNRG